ncbi:MAG: hypothetical protein RMJ56_11590 [Gemmataceae bacterium]|nr:hypothetical protein [Gemmata sp.]MDW8198234.1 hypothetical protein [Gemmataceae bacterium]
MTVRALTLATGGYVLAAVLLIGCSKTETVPTDPESLKQAAEEFNRRAQEENKAKQKDKAQPVD